MSPNRSFTPAEQFVVYALSIGALEIIPEGRALKSGRISPYFFNSGLFNTGRRIDRLAHTYAITLDAPFGKEVEVVFGPAYKGIPLSVAVAMKWAIESGFDVEYAFNRKEAKSHGEGGIIVGASLAGKKVLLIDDVIADGGTKREAMDIVTQKDGIPIGLIIAFDRQERGKESELSAVQEFQKNYGIPVEAAATLADLISVLQKTPAESGDDNVGEMLEKILEYRRQYGVS